MTTLELFLFGFAAVVDGALLLSLWEPTNRGRVAVWLQTLIVGAAMIHGAIFFRLMIQGAPGASLLVLDRFLVVCVCGGLLLLPSAMLHAALRLHRTGIEPEPPRDLRYLWVYAPLAWLPMIGGSVWASPATDFATQVDVWRNVYLIGMAGMNAASIILFLRSRGERLTPQGDRFLVQLSVVIALSTLLAIAYACWAIGTPMETPLRLLAVLSPLAAALLFVWHSMHGRLVPLVMERTLGYAVMLVGVLLAHRVVVTPVSVALRERFQIDFVLVEGIAIVFVILLIPKLRRRVAESLRHLFSSNVIQVRDAIRQISVGLSRNATRDPVTLSEWFATELGHQFQLDHVTILLDDAAVVGGITITRSSRVATVNDSILTEEMKRIHHCIVDFEAILERGSIDNADVNSAMRAESVLLGFRLDYRGVSGSVLLGDRIRNDRLARDQALGVSLLVDQFAATLHNRREEILRQRAERKLLHQEKLSTLGLLSGSLAHELRNPLSSMRTITTLVMEDLGPDHEGHRDLQMVVSEIDRLTSTTNRLLDYAKPESECSSRVEVDQVADRILCILEYLARENHVTLVVQLAGLGATIDADEAAIGEIVFNLVKNAIEATRQTTDGCVEVTTRTCEDRVILSVADNGCGIAPERRATLFQAFQTSKPDGNGLGLYAVGERVAELRGEITVREREPCGTVFEVCLPRVPVKTSKILAP